MLALIYQHHGSPGPWAIRRPFVPSVCFAIETSQNAIERGFSWAALEALEKVFQDGWRIWRI